MMIMMMMMMMMMIIIIIIIPKNYPEEGKWLNKVFVRYK